MRSKVAIFCVLFILSRGASAQEFEKLGNAIGKALGTKTVFKETSKLEGKDYDVYFSKGKNGKANKYAIVQEGTYPPDCDHMWVIAVDTTPKIKDIRVVSMKCPHAFPTKTNSFLGQFKGKGPGDIKKLNKRINFVSKATGSSDLTRDAVVRSIKIAKNSKGKF